MTSFAARRWAIALLLAIAVAAAGLFVETDARGVQVFGQAVPELCPSAAMGIECPGCGSTRAAVHLLHGDLAGAWSLQPGVFPLFALGAFLLLPVGRKPSTRRWAFAAASGLYLFSWLPF